MKAIVCVKQTPSTEAVFSVDGGNVSWDDPQGKPNIVNPWDEFAIEAGVQLKENHGADPVALSVGDDSCDEQLKMALAMGCVEAVRVTDASFDGSGTHATARILAAAVRNIGDADVVVCGKQAIDGDSGLTPVMLAKELGYTPLTYVSAITALGDGKITVERVLDDGKQVVTASLPVVMSVTKEIGEPRYPSFMGIRKANKATIPVLTAADLGISGEVGVAKVDYSNVYKEEVVASDVQIISGDSAADIAKQLADKLFEEKVI